MSLVSIVIYLIFAPQAQAQIKTTNGSCVKKIERIEVSDDINPSYMRVHPEGKYIVYTDHENESSAILEIIKKNNNNTIKNYSTPMKIEAFPVEPNWEIISSPYHNDGTMKYFLLTDLLTQKPEDVKEVHSSRFNEFYHSIGGSGSKFSVLRWNFLGTKDFEVSRNNNNKVEIKESAVPYIMCHNLFNLPIKSSELIKFLNEGLIRIQGVFAMDSYPDTYTQAEEELAKEYLKRGIDITENDTITESVMETYYQEVDALTMKYDIKILQGYVKSGLLQQQDLDNYIQFNTSFNANLKGSKKAGDQKIYEAIQEMDQYILTKPILSKDLKFISGFYEGATRVYKINPDKSCTEISSLGADVSKAGFAYPETFKNPVISFYVEDESNWNKLNLYVHDAVTKETIQIDSVKTFSEMGYPGFTKDGRLIYMHENKIIISTLKITDDKNLDTSCR